MITASTPSEPQSPPASKKPRTATLPCSVELSGIRVQGPEEAQEILAGMFTRGILHVVTADGIKLKLRTTA